MEHNKHNKNTKGRAPKVKTEQKIFTIQTIIRYQTQMPERWGNRSPKHLVQMRSLDISIPKMNISCTNYNSKLYIQKKVIILYIGCPWTKRINPKQTICTNIAQNHHQLSRKKAGIDSKINFGSRIVRVSPFKTASQTATPPRPPPHSAP